MQETDGKRITKQTDQYDNNTPMARETKGVNFHQTYSFLREDNPSQQLIFQTLHGHSEINDGRTSRNLWCVRWIRQLCCNIQAESVHHINFLIPDLDLVSGANLDEVFLKDIIQSWIQFLHNVFYEDWTAKRKAILKMLTEVFVVEIG